MPEENMKFFVRLGKKPKKTDPRTLHLSKYLPKLPVPPSTIDHASKLPADIGMMLNDQLGDCTVAAAGHMIQSWTAYASTILTIPDADIKEAYLAVSPNDDGAYMLDVLNYWRNTSIGEDKIEAFVETDTSDLIQAKLAIEYFGSAYIGMALPDTNTYGPWTATNPTWPPNPNKGHAVCLLAYDDNRQMFKVATWGEVWDMSYGWFTKYCDESYATLNDIMLIIATGKSPEGFDWASLQYDLQHLGDPVITTTPAPTPGPTTTPAPTTTPIPVTPPPVPLVAPDGPIIVTALGSAYWTVYVNGVAQTPQHSQQFEAVQHADALRWKIVGTNSTIEIRHNAVYTIK